MGINSFSIDHVIQFALNNWLLHLCAPSCKHHACQFTILLKTRKMNDLPIAQQSWQQRSFLLEASVFFSRNPWGEIPSLGSPNMFSKNNVSKTSSSQTVVIILSTQTMHDFSGKSLKITIDLPPPKKKQDPRWSQLVIPVKTGFRFHLADSRVGLLGRKSVDTRHDSTLTTRKGWDEENTRNGGKKRRCFLFFLGGFTVGAGVYVYIICIIIFFL